MTTWLRWVDEIVMSECSKCGMMMKNSKCKQCFMEKLSFLMSIESSINVTMLLDGGSFSPQSDFL